MNLNVEITSYWIHLNLNINDAVKNVSWNPCLQKVREEMKTKENAKVAKEEKEKTELNAGKISQNQENSSPLPSSECIYSNC